MRARVVARLFDKVVYKYIYTVCYNKLVWMYIKLFLGAET